MLCAHFHRIMPVFVEALVLSVQKTQEIAKNAQNQHLNECDIYRCPLVRHEFARIFASYLVSFDAELVQCQREHDDGVKKTESVIRELYCILHKLIRGHLQSIADFGNKTIANDGYQFTVAEEPAEGQSYTQMFRLEYVCVD